MARRPNTEQSIQQKFRPEYCALKNAIHRCHNPDHLAYKNYGARGITVCPEWRNGIEGLLAFLDHIGPRPSDLHSLDRIDNDQGYWPGNVRWTDRKTQQANRRPKAHNITDYGWGIGHRVHRNKNGHIARRQSALIECFGRTQTVAEWCLDLNLKRATVRQRLERGMTPEEALSGGSYKSGRGKKVHSELPFKVELLDEPNDPAREAVDLMIARLDKAMADINRPTLH